MTDHREHEGAENWVGLGAGVFDPDAPTFVAEDGSVWQYASDTSGGAGEQSGMQTGTTVLPALSNEFFIQIQDSAKRLGVLPEDLLVVMAGESGLNPHMAKGGGYGIISLTNEAKGGAGITDLAAFSALSGEAQLPYVENYFKNASAGFPYRNAFDLYFAEAATGTYAKYRKQGTIDPNEVMYSGGAWANNPGLDNYPNLTKVHGAEITADFKRLGPGAYSQIMAKWAAIGKSEGLLKGWVNVGDFVRYAQAVLRQSNWRDGVRRLRLVQGKPYSVATDPYTPAALKSKAGQDPSDYDANSRMAPIGIAPQEAPPIRQTGHISRLGWFWLGGGILGSIALLRIFLRKGQSSR